MTQPITDRQLNRWTLARQLLLDRAPLDAVTALSRLAGMQAQYSPSPYIGLWSRLAGFERSELEQAVLEDRAIKATLMRGTLHLAAGSEFDLYQAATRNPDHYAHVRKLEQRGVDVAAVRTEILEAVRERPLTRVEIGRITQHHIPPDLGWGGWHAIAIVGDLVNLPDDARFGYFGTSRYRLRPNGTDPAIARKHLVEAYFAAFGPATRADFSQWVGRPLALFAAELKQVDLVEMKAADGRALHDLAGAPRPDPEVPAPVRFLSKWDNLLLAYARRGRVLPEPYRTTVIRKNGDVLPTFLVDGLVAGTWEAPQRGKAVLTLTPLRRLTPAERRSVEAEGEALLAWLRPDMTTRNVGWGAGGSSPIR